MQKWTRAYAALALLMVAVLAVGFYYTYRDIEHMMTEQAEVATVQSKLLTAGEIGSWLTRMASVVEGIGSFVQASGDEEALLQPYLAHLDAANPFFSSVFFGRADGGFTMSYDWEQPEWFDHTTRDWYQRALVNDDIVFADFYEDAAGHGRITSVVTAIYDDAGQLLGVAGADLPLAHLETYVHNHPNDHDTIHFVVDAQGNTIQLCGHWSLEQPWGQPLAAVIGGLVLDNPEARSEPIHVELDRVGGILAVHEVAHSHWYVASFMPYDSMPAVGSQVWMRFFNMALVVLILFALLYIVQHRWFAAPLTHLAADIDRIDLDGDLGYRVADEPKSTTASLRRSANAMLARLQDAVESLRADEEELRAVNEELESALTQLHATEQELRQHNEELLASQEQLAASDAYNRSIIDLIPDLMFRLDADGRLLDFPSSEGWDRFGASDEAEGKLIEDILPSDLAQLLHERMIEALKTASMVRFETSVQLPALGEAFFEARFLPAEDSVLALVRDVTQQRQAEQTKDDWQRLMQYIIRYDPNAIAVLDKDLNHIFVSERFVQDYNVEGRDIIGQHHYEVFPDIPEPWRLVHQRALAGEVSSGEEEEYNRADGSVEYTRWECRPWYERDGTVGGIILYTEVITRQRQTEQALQASEQYRQSLLHLIPDAIIHYDQQGTYLDIMASNSTILYRPQDEVLGHTVHEILPAKAAAAIQGAIVEALAAGTIQAVEYGLKENGDHGWYEARMLPINEREVVALIRDITERKRAEDELTRLTYYDVLTDLRNRRYVEQMLDEWERKEPVVGAMLVDVNGLKIVNDSLGHEVGDELLRRAAKVIAEVVRSHDLVGRWGGDEFVVLLPGAGLADLENMAQRILELAAAETTGPVPLSMAVGFAVRTDTSKELRVVLKEAEDEMYRHKSRHSQSSRSTLVRSLRRTLEAKSFETQEHCTKLEAWAVRLGRRLQLPERDIDEISLLAVLHDLGKVGIAEDILTKPGPLTEDEWVIMRQHPEIGHRIAMASPDLVMVAEGILSHHERWDGGGYPQGLKGRQIPLSARIVAIADAFEAMVSDRPYRKALGIEPALTEITACAGSQFDPFLARNFVEMMRELMPLEDEEKADDASGQ